MISQDWKLDDGTINSLNKFIYIYKFLGSEIRVSGNEKKTNITKYFLKKIYIDIYYLNISY